MPIKIDLGKKPGDCNGQACTAPVQKDKPTVYYPTLYLDDLPGLDALPDSGEITLRFKVTSRTTRETPDGEHCSLSLDLKSITGLKAGEVSEPAKDDYDKRASNLEELAKEVEAESEKGDDGY